jgi:hypothetical protein
MSQIINKLNTQYVSFSCLPVGDAIFFFFLIPFFIVKNVTIRIPTQEAIPIALKMLYRDLSTVQN